MLLTGEELASFVGTTRETATCVLNRLQESKFIQIHGSAITIVALRKLDQLTL